MKEEDLGAKEANERRPEAQTGVAHADRFLGRVGPTFWSLGSVAIDLFAHDSDLT